MRERCLKIGSAGKTFSLTGWKVGYVAGAAPLLVGVPVGGLGLYAAGMGHVWPSLFLLAVGVVTCAGFSREDLVAALDPERFRRSAGGSDEGPRPDARAGERHAGEEDAGALPGQD